MDYTGKALQQQVGEAAGLLDILIRVTEDKLKGICFSLFL